MQLATSILSHVLKLFRGYVADIVQKKFGSASVLISGSVSWFLTLTWPLWFIMMQLVFKLPDLTLYGSNFLQAFKMEYNRYQTYS